MRFQRASRGRRWRDQPRRTDAAARHRGRAAWRCLVLGLPWLCLLSGGGAALAQQSGSGATDPGKIEQRIDRPEPVRPSVAPIAPPAPAPAPAPPAERFVLIGAEIEGATVYPPGELATLYEPFLGRSISVAEVEQITNAITEKYRGDGYFLARAFAPAQDAALGVLYIQVVEGYVDQVRFKGDPPGRRALFDRWAAKITAERPLTLARLERYLLLMADTPGLVVRPTINPLDEQSGSYILDLALEYKPVDGFFSLDNRGTTAVGPVQGYAGANINSALRLHERTRIAAFTIPGEPEELRYGELYQEHVLTSEGTRLWGLASRSIVDIGRAGSSDKENAHGTRVALGLTQSVIRRREENLNLTLKAEAVDSDKVSASEVFDDRVRVLRLGADYAVQDGLGGTNWIVGEVSRGLDILHASDQGATLISRTNGRSDFVKWTLDLTRQQKLIEHWALQAAVAGQISPQTLLSAEEFAVGGRRFGRAYDPADISGSNGAAGYVELQYDPPIKIEPLASWQLYAFWDLGAVWSQGFNRRSMASAGGGMRFGLPWGLTGGLEVAQPLTRAVTPGESDSDFPRVFFSLAGRF